MVSFQKSLGPQATCRFGDLTFPHGGFWSLEEANRGDLADDAGGAAAATAVFAAAPFVEEDVKVEFVCKNVFFWFQMVFL